MEICNKQKNIYYSVIKSSRIAYNAHILSLYKKTNSKSFYSHFHKLSGNSLPKVLPTNFSDVELVNKFAEFFQKKVIAIRSSFSDCCEAVEDCNVNPEQPSVSAYMSEFNYITEDQFNLILSSLNKNYQFDPIPLNLFKLRPTAFNPVLHYIVSRSLTEASFPSDLKHATITPIIKNTNLDPEILKNYRLISNTPYLAKVLEKAAFYQINDHLINNELICTYQSGYKQNYSCETAIIGIANDIQEITFKDKLAAVFMLDLSAAFDTVDHDRLLFKLDNGFNISGKVLQWLRSFLMNRTSSVVLNRVRSPKLLVVYGVPQGSILGSLLFILYVCKRAKLFG